MNKVFEIMPGEEIRTSAISRILGVIVASALLPLGVVCLLAQYYLLFPEAPRVGLYMSFLLYSGIVMIILGALGIPISIYMALRPERLIIGEDRYQRVVGESKVTENVPFVSISELVLKHMTTEIGLKINTKQIGIMLHSPTDNSILIANDKEMELTGYHSTIGDNYMQPLESIYEKLLAKWNACRKHGTSP